MARRARHALIRRVRRGFTVSAVDGLVSYGCATAAVDGHKWHLLPASGTMPQGGLQMSTAYTGLYVERLADETVHSVQVKDPFGHSVRMSPELYVARDVQPPIEQLPDRENYLLGALPDKR